MSAPVVAAYSGWMSNIIIALGIVLVPAAIVMVIGGWYKLKRAVRRFMDSINDADCDR